MSWIRKQVISWYKKKIFLSHCSHFNPLILYRSWPGKLKILDRLTPILPVMEVSLNIIFHSQPGRPKTTNIGRSKPKNCRKYFFIHFVRSSIGDFFSWKKRKKRRGWHGDSFGDTGGCACEEGLYGDHWIKATNWKLRLIFPVYTCGIYHRISLFHNGFLLFSIVLTFSDGTQKLSLFLRTILLHLGLAGMFILKNLFYSIKAQLLK